ncbi:MAG TPA: helix-turn-helix transcriptional regulator [Aggregatilineales bacterium]|nr:helix-turn-helix transcriptional regulator [Aggregatilineales bacterium]
MSFGDIAARLKKKQEEQTPEISEVRNFEEIHTLRARILGVLIRDARTANSQSEADLAAALSIEPDQITRWELGQESPSLPQLEQIAFALGVPVSRFWDTRTISQEKAERRVPGDQYNELRDRVIGALLTVARKDAQLSQEELATASGLTVEQIAAYEFGQRSVPFSELTSLASSLHKPISYFLVDTGRIGQWLALQEEYRRFSELPEELRAFVAQPVNQPFIALALRLSRIPVQELRKVGEDILEITF